MTNARYFYTTLTICGLIFIACLLMAGPMRGGMPVGGDLTSRVAFIQANLTLWQLGWLLWMSCALGLMLFACLLATALPQGMLRTIGLTLVCLGIVPDLSAETLYAFILPQLAQHGASLESLQLVDQLAMYLTGFLGNGLYNLGGLLLSIELWRSQLILRRYTLLGVVAWLLGLGLSASIAMQQLGAAEALTAASMTLSTLWFLLIAWQLWGKTHATA